MVISRVCRCIVAGTLAAVAEKLIKIDDIQESGGAIVADIVNRK